MAGRLVLLVIQLYLADSWIGDVAREQPMTSSWMLSTATTVSPTPTSNHSGSSSDCGRNFRFSEASVSNLCNMQATRTYSKSQRAQYTCSGRCGSVPAISAETPGCACDSSCIVYGDCCEDTALACPDLHARGQTEYAHLVPAYSVCDKIHTNVIPACKATISSRINPTNPFIQNAGPLAKIPSNGPPGVAQPKTSISPGINTVEYFSSSLGEFKVIDYTLNVAFDKYETFKSCRSVNSVPQFIPKEATLLCPTLSVPGTAVDHVIEELARCKKSSVRNVRTELDRECADKNLQFCQCQSGSMLSLSHNRICLVAELSKNLLTSKSPTTWSMDVNDSNSEISHLREVGPCILHNISIAPIQSKPPTFSSIQRGGSMAISVIPVELNANMPGPFGRSYRNHLNLSNAEIKPRNLSNSLFGDKETNSTFLRQSELPTVSREQDIVYIVELTNTLEKRLACQSLSNVLAECRLLECIDGAVLTPSTLSPYRFGQVTCAIPDRASIEMDIQYRPVPICTCMRVMTAMQRLGVWTVKLMSVSISQCVLGLHRVIKGVDSPPLVYSASKLHDISRPPDESVQLLSHKLNVKLRRLLLESRGACRDDSEAEPIQICFHFTEELNENDRMLRLRQQDVELRGWWNVFILNFYSVP
ncbi:hypothetical protein PoB_007616500 [Plakobranchus ocellatus]|uniref:SMB domain-containing protein n=1 Tax=Plakobranchus ocellatus TaxID=259542 RepID=A0AAV4DZT7_9GAST|nr:hypothetical protein PoB_007616500 [Plakobranchus ocellatus]